MNTGSTSGGAPGALESSLPLLPDPISSAPRTIMSTALDVTENTWDSAVLQSEMPVLADFWAPWCGPCKSITPILEKLSGEYGGKVKVGKVNIDSEPALAQAFRVRSIPTIIGLVGGEVQDNSVGFRGEQPLREMFEKLSS